MTSSPGTPFARPTLAVAPVAIPLAIALTLLTGCGGSTKTVSVQGGPTAAAANGTNTATATTDTTASTPTPTTSTAAPSTSDGTSATSTRSAAEPRFVEGESSSGGSSSSSTPGLSGALATLTAHGYATKDTTVYHPNQTLRVLVGTRTGSSDGYAQQAFFFVDGHYIGTDASAPSAHVEVLSQNDTEVTLGYPLYRAGDPLCCPGGGQGKVRFQLNDGQLAALGQIPAVEPSGGVGRR
jgi:LppP/LprE lipoprotein